MFPARARTLSALFLTLMLTAILLLLIAAPATAVPITRYVNWAKGVDTGDCILPDNPCKTISYAIDKSFQGDDIKVAQGVYHENLVITDNVNLYGGYVSGDWSKRADGHGTTIDGRKMGSAVRYEDGFQGTLDGFKITNGKAAQGGGIYSKYGNTNLKLQNLLIIDNEATDAGGGVFLDNGNGTVLDDCEIENNKAANKGGGIAVNYGSSNLSGLLVKENQAASGGGISIYSSGIITLSGSNLRMNTASSQSGAVHLEHGELRAADTIFAGNKAGDHGGAITAEGSQLKITNGLFYGNSTTTGAASVLATSTTDVQAVNTTIADNAASGHQAVLVWSGFFHLHNGIMWNNALNIQTDPPCPSCVKVTYSDVQGHVDNPVQDKNNIDADPMFLNAASRIYRLKSGSPCINAGAANGVNPVPPNDITGRPRDGKPDMGAYEYAPPVYKYRVYLPVVMGK